MRVHVACDVFDISAAVRVCAGVCELKVSGDERLRNPSGWLPRSTRLWRTRRTSSVMVVLGGQAKRVRRRKR